MVYRPLLASFKQLFPGATREPWNGSLEPTSTLGAERAGLEASSERPTEVHWRLDQGRWKLTWGGLETLTLDTCLRPVTAACGGDVYLRGLDGRVLRILQQRVGPHSFRQAVPLTPPEKSAWLSLWEQRLHEVVGLDQPWTQRLAEDERRFRLAYPQPVSILPPDRYRSLVFQLTRGCSWNKCSFCNLYQDRTFGVKSSVEFEQHVDRVLDYFGPALNWRQGVFLGDANAGSCSPKRLLEALETVSRRVPQFASRVAVFQDTFSGKPRSVGQWQELRSAGLEQVNLGVESGSAAILQLLNKPAQGECVIRMVERCKEAGLKVSLIFMLGVGGVEGAGEHEKETVALLQRLPLERGDRVYFSELLIVPGRPYAGLGLTPLSRLECRLQMQRIREQLGWLPAPVGPYLSLYDVRQFIYH